MGGIMRRSAIVTAVLLSAACGSDSTGPEQPFEQTITGQVAAFGTTSHAVTPPRGGTFRAVLTWQVAAVDLDLYLTDASCSVYPVGNCTILAESSALTGTTETVQHTVTAGQQLKLWVDNFSTTQSASYSVAVSVR
jgi:hypothetical protein